jgi:DNA mismatch repair protein PMS2
MATSALKHYTSKLSSFTDLSTIRTFGFRGEALSSLCALSESLVVTTTTAPPMGVSLEMDTSGKVRKKHKVARQVSFDKIFLIHLFIIIAPAWNNCNSYEPLSPASRPPKRIRPQLQA